MSREFPDWINPWKAAEGGRIYSGSIPLERMRRLTPLLQSAKGMAAFKIAFALDGQKRVTVALQVKAELPLLCQASLEPFKLKVERESLLAVLEEGENEEQLPEHYDPVRPEDGRLQFADLVEDELLLAVPQVPRKPGMEHVRYCTDPADTVETETEEQNRPFAALKDLMRGGRDDQNSETD